MNVLWIGATHPRHVFYGNALHEAAGLCGAVVQRRENIIPQPPSGCSARDIALFRRHFEERDEAEARYFGTPDLPDCETLECTAETLNEEKTAAWVRAKNPDVVMIFGCGMIRDPLFSALPPDSVNMHLGLSPRYRGAATLFWPFYFMQPNQAGATFHHIVSEPDAGDIIHQVVPDLKPEDGIHDVSCRTVVEAARAARDLLRLRANNGSWRTFKQRGTGKNFLQKDFQPEHLRVIYEVFDNDMVREYLEGRLTSPAPRLVSQF